MSWCQGAPAGNMTHEPSALRSTVRAAAGAARRATIASRAMVHTAAGPARRADIASGAAPCVGPQDNAYLCLLAIKPGFREREEGREAEQVVRCRVGE